MELQAHDTPRVGRHAPLPALQRSGAVAQSGHRSPALRGEHLRRMNAVFAYIDAHLAEDLSLARLADRAAFSPFHFHRLFFAWTGETSKTFVRRRRLEEAAARLSARPHEKVTDIARACGFASPEAFARAFREHFGTTPSGWRTGGPRVPAGSAFEHDDAAAA